MPVNGSFFTRFVNNNSSPQGGPNPDNATHAFDGSDIANWSATTGLVQTPGADCPWTVNNCGLNDEPFSFHPGGCSCVYCDGSTHFLRENIEPSVMRALVTRSDGENIPATKLPQ